MGMNQFYCEMLQLTIAVHRKPTTYNVESRYWKNALGIGKQCALHGVSINANVSEGKCSYHIKYAQAIIC